MTRYRLYTERFDNIGSIVDDYFEGFTLIPAVGYWRGAPEDSVIIEIVTNQPASDVAKLAEHLRSTNHQQAVMVTSEPVTVEWALIPHDSMGAPTTGPLGDLPAGR